MKRLSFKSKIYSLLSATLLVMVIFFGFVYRWIDDTNQALAGTVAQKTQEYAELQAEQKSYELGKKDLVALQSKPFQPEDLFSQDTKVVKEIKTLETLAHGLGVDFTLQVSGTIKTAPKLTKAFGQLYTVPYTVIVDGPFDKVVNYIETTEHLNFVTSTKSVTVGAVDAASVRATLSSEFYIKP